MPSNPPGLSKDNADLLQRVGLAGDDAFHLSGEQLEWLLNAARNEAARTQPEPGIWRRLFPKRAHVSAKILPFPAPPAPPPPVAEEPVAPVPVQEPLAEELLDKIRAVYGQSADEPSPPRPRRR